MTEITHRLETYDWYFDLRKSDIESYRSTAREPYHCAIYLKDGRIIYVTEIFEYVDSLFGEETK